LNIIFDLGGVVLQWQPQKLIKQVFFDESTQRQVFDNIICHPDWQELDRGTIEQQQMIVRAEKRTGIPQSKIEELMKQAAISLTPIQETLDIAYALKHEGHHLFVLSNMHKAFIKYLKSTWHFWDLFEGQVISCHIHKIKPELEIFDYTIKRYSLSPMETVFIDDTSVNIDAAKNYGIMAIKFENPKQCEKELRTIINYYS